MSSNKYFSIIDKLSKHELAIPLSFIFSGLALHCVQKPSDKNSLDKNSSDKNSLDKNSSDKNSSDNMSDELSIPVTVSNTIILSIFYNVLTNLIIPSKFKPVFCFGLISLTLVEISRRLVTGDRSSIKLLNKPMFNIQMYSNRIIRPAFKMIKYNIMDTILEDMIRITYINHPLYTDNIPTFKVNKLVLQDVISVLEALERRKRWITDGIIPDRYHLAKHNPELGNYPEVIKAIPLIRRLLSLSPEETNIDQMKSLFIHGKYKGYMMIKTVENKDENNVMSINID